jgi:(2Fe-2S) ferredoxin
MTDAPPKRRRIVLCRGTDCNADRRADGLYKKLLPVVEELNGDAYPPRIKLEIASCLDMCEKGPNLMLYPEKTAFNYVDEKQLDEIIEKYLEQGT